ncbi:MAG: ATP-binding cassette domain-containing protein [Phycisphaerales bacterium]|jgi:putative ABC transport system ATP-binding protein|nr:ATP-binding cassette domain-containing protein [Phycisphaerales bacterium]
MTCTDDILFEARDLTVALAGKTLCADVTLTLRRGDVLGLVGPSGCGKSTLLRVLAGLIEPANGTLGLEGTPIAEWAMPDYRRRVLLLGQTPALMDDTVEANLRLPFSFEANAERDYDPATAEALLERLGVESARLSQPARSLSLGQQQRVCLVRGLLLEPSVILMDEPTSALDAASVAAVEALLAQIVAERNIAAVIVSHDANQIARITSNHIELPPSG